LRRFKEPHAEKLRKCRTYLDAKLADIASTENHQQRDVLARQVLVEISDDVAVLIEKMEKRRWPKVTMLGFSGVMGAALTVASAAVGADATPLMVGLAAGTGALELGAAGFGAAGVLRTPRYDERAPLAYAALVSKV
jgi:hypothetical protein